MKQTRLGYSYAFARFIFIFCKVAKTVLPPAMMDVREGLDVEGLSNIEFGSW